MAEDDSFSSLPTGWASRTLRTGRAAASLGRAVAKRAARKALGHEGDVEADRNAAAELLSRLDNLKGMSQKMGQMISYLDGLVPEGTQQALSKLQDRATPMAPEVVRQVLLYAFGEPPEALFEAFDERPFAAASIGQVHRAVFAGRPVAVKVQYPGIGDTIDVDLGNLKRTGLLAHLATGLDIEGVMHELRDRMREEIRYEQEASFQRMFVGLFADDPGVVIPDIVPERCRPTVLTTELVEGMGFQRFLETADAETREIAARRMFGFAWRSIFTHGVFNADPQPGNYLFFPDGRVAFLDFGCVRFWQDDLLQSWTDIAHGVLGGERSLVDNAMLRTGFVRDRARFDFDANFQVLSYLYEPMTRSPFRFTSAYVQRSWELLIAKNPNARFTELKPEWVMVNRLQWGLYSLLARMDVESDFASVFRAQLDAPLRRATRPAPLS